MKQRRNYSIVTVHVNLGVVIEGKELVQLEHQLLGWKFQKKTEKKIKFV